MPGSLIWGWDATNKKWLPISVSETGAVKILETVDHLDDIGDVSVPTPTDGYVLYWDAATSLWKAKAHADLTTGVHGVGANYIPAAPAASHLVRTFTKGWTTNKILRGNGLNADPLEIEGGTYFSLPTADQVMIYKMVGVTTGPRTATVSSVAAQVVTLTGDHAYRFGLWTQMVGNARLKIYNSTRLQYVWVVDSPAVNQLTIKTGDDISAWQNLDTITTATDGAASTFHQIETIDSVLVAAQPSALVASCRAKDTGTIADLKGLVVGPDFVVTALVTTRTSIGLAIFDLDSELKFIVSDRATGTDTLFDQVYIIGYIK